MSERTYSKEVALVRSIASSTVRTSTTITFVAAAFDLALPTPFTLYTISNELCMADERLTYCNGRSWYADQFRSCRLARHVVLGVQSKEWFIYCVKDVDIWPLKI